MQDVAYFMEMGNALVDIFLAFSLNISTIRKQKLQNYVIGLNYKQIGSQRWNEHRGKGRNREMAMTIPIKICVCIRKEWTKSGGGGARI